MTRIVRTSSVSILYLVIAVFPQVALPDEVGSGMKRAYEEMKTAKNPAEQEKIFRDRVAAPSARKEAERLKKQEADSRQAMTKLRSSKWGGPGPRLEAEKLRAMELAKKGGAKAAPMAQASPTGVPLGQGNYSSSISRPIQQPISNGPAPGYTGPVEGGGVTEVIEFNPQPMKTPAPR